MTITRRSALPLGGTFAFVAAWWGLSLLRIWGATEKTILFVTHQIEEAVFLADRVLVLTARPATVKLSVTIDLARPRDLTVKRKPEFIHYEEAIWQSIRAEI